MITRGATATQIFGDCDTLVSALTAPRLHAEPLRVTNVDELLPSIPLSPDGAPPTHALLLVGSAKPQGTSTSQVLGTELLQSLAARGVETEVRFVSRVTHSATTLAKFVAEVRTHQLLIVASPIYIDALPALVTKALEAIATDRTTSGELPELTVAMILNCGFPEARHASVARTIGALFARKAKARWAGALQLGCGGMINGRSLGQVGHLAAHLPTLLSAAAASLAEGRSISPETRDEFREPLMPTALYVLAGDAGWLWTSLHEGALTRLWQRPAEAGA
jgi:hypothetical protein